MTTFSAIIPAYNEWPRIEKMLEAIIGCKELDEIIVINDGSTDDTKEKIKKFTDPRIIFINKERNGWKLKAVFDGVEKSTGSHIVMVDADYIGFKSDFLSQIIKPVQEWKYDTTMIMWRNSMFICKLMKHDIFSGTRVLPKEIFANTKEYLSGKGFSLEVKINEEIYQRKFRVKSFYFPEVYNPPKGWKQIWIQQPIHILSSYSLWKIWKHMWYIYKQQ